MKQKLLKLAQHAAEQAPDAVMVSGAGAVSFGAGLIYVPAGWIVGGLFLIAIGLMWAGSRK